MTGRDWGNLRKEAGGVALLDLDKFIFDLDRVSRHKKAVAGFCACDSPDL